MQLIQEEDLEILDPLLKILVASKFASVKSKIVNIIRRNPESEKIRDYFEILGRSLDSVSVSS